MWKIKLSRKIEVLYVGHMLQNPRWRMRKHVHEYHELVVVERGILHVASAAGNVKATAGDAFFYPSGVWHSESSDLRKPSVHFCLGVRAAMRGAMDGIIHTVDHHGRMTELLRWIHSHLTRVTPVSDVECKALVTAIIEEFNRAVDESGKTLSTATRNYIQEHIAEPLTLDTLASEVGMSRYHFLRRYKTETGRTPMQDVREIRARYARQLIVGSHTPLKEVAALAGLGTVQMLSETFTKVFNRPPAQFRKK